MDGARSVEAGRGRQGVLSYSRDVDPAHEETVDSDAAQGVGSTAPSSAVSARRKESRSVAHPKQTAVTDRRLVTLPDSIGVAMPQAAARMALRTRKSRVRATSSLAMAASGVIVACEAGWFARRRGHFTA